jgi:GNAT superfamily N-acetyltransferase
MATERHLLLKDGTALDIQSFSQADHSVAEITELLHRSYKQLADMGFRYWATHQDDSVTIKRLLEGHSLVVCAADRIVGTIAICGPDQTHGSPWYDRSEVSKFGQFAVDPALQGQGIGSRLVGLAENLVRDLGARELALDTAEGATHLIALYTRLGYRFIEYAQWNMANYRSVILSKTLP